MTRGEAAGALVALFEAKATVDGRIRVEDLLNIAGAVTGEACIAAAGEFDPAHHDFAPGSIVMSDAINTILCDNASEWSDAAASVFGIVRAGAFANGYDEGDLPRLTDIFAPFAAAVGSGGVAGWGFVPLTVAEGNRPFVQPLRQSFELRSSVSAVLQQHDVPTEEWPLVCALAVTTELGRVREAIDRGVAMRLVLETVNGMAKMAPMTNDAMRGASEGSA